MEPKVMQAILEFYISKLSESDLRELDDLLEGTSYDRPAPEKASTPAQDAALGSKDRQSYLRAGPSGRKAMRAAGMLRHGAAGQMVSMATDGAADLEYAKRFPNAERLRGTY